MAPQIDPNINPLIWTAIEQKRLLRFRHKNRERIVEPHDYGIHNGVIKLFGYQVAGSSSRKLPTWRWAEQDLMSDIHMLDRPFLVAAQPSRVSTINGTSCSSESNHPISTRNRRSVLTDDALRTLTESSRRTSIFVWKPSVMPLFRVKRHMVAISADQEVSVWPSCTS